MCRIERFGELLVEVIQEVTCKSAQKNDLSFKVELEHITDVENIYKKYRNNWPPSNLSMEDYENKFFAKIKNLIDSTIAKNNKHRMTAVALSCQKKFRYYVDGQKRAMVKAIKIYNEAINYRE